MLERVTDLTLYNTRPFEHEFFQWISQAFPLLKYLKVNNLTSQKNKCIHNKEISSKITYLHLMRLNLTDAHIDYADQFLCDTNAYIPHLSTLVLQYEKLVNVTNEFTNDKTRHNCSQLKKLIFDQLLAHQEHFYLYFTSLITEFSFDYLLYQ
jgi:hypothetical protein